MASGARQVTNRQRMDAVKNAAADVLRLLDVYADARRGLDAELEARATPGASDAEWAATMQAELMAFTGDHESLAGEILEAMNALRARAYEYNVGLDRDSPVFGAAAACAAACGTASPFGVYGNSELLDELAGSCDCPAAAAYARQVVLATCGGRRSDYWLSVDGKIEAVIEDLTACVPANAFARNAINAMNSATAAWDATLREFQWVIERVDMAVSR